MAAAALDYSPITQHRPLIPARRSQKTPRQYLDLQQHHQTLTHEEVLMKYAEGLDQHYRVKIPKPLYREATEARRASMARNGKRPPTYSIVSTAGKGKQKGSAIKSIKDLAEAIFIPTPTGGPSRPSLWSGQRRPGEEYDFT